jgi:hypothetical protein
MRAQENGSLRLLTNAFDSFPYLLLTICVTCAADFCAMSPSPDDQRDLSELYDKHEWFQLRDAVIVEARMTGTHRAEWAGLPPKGNKLDLPLVCVFDFEGDKLVNEKIYFDFAAVQRQLG